MAFHTAFSASNTLSCDSPQQALAFVAVGRRGGCPKHKIMRCGRRYWIDERLQCLFVHMHFLLVRRNVYSVRLFRISMHLRNRSGVVTLRGYARGLNGQNRNNAYGIAEKMHMKMYLFFFDEMKTNELVLEFSGVILRVLLWFFFSLIGVVQFCCGCSGCCVGDNCWLICRSCCVLMAIVCIQE